MKTQTKRDVAKAGSSPSTTEAEQHDSIAKAAYFLAEQRGFVTGFELQDWLSAEAEVRAQLDRT